MRVLQRVRDKGSRFFYWFGIHCATHQIRLILISVLVITCLLYPALAIYTSSNPRNASKFYLFALNPFYKSDAPLFSHLEDDVQDLWVGQTALRMREDPVASAMCRQDSTIRMERVFLAAPISHDMDVLNYRTLQAALDLENQLTDFVASKQIPCVAPRGGRCLVISPLEFWSHDRRKLASDEDLLRTINSSRNVSLAGLPITPAMTLAGRGVKEQSPSAINSASHLVITFLFRDGDCHRQDAHKSWLHALSSNFTSTVEIIPVPDQPLLLTLEFDPNSSSAHRGTLITVLVYLAYMIIFVYFSGSMRGMNTVHSRIGLCFTGLLEILSSLVTSLSVCAIGGLKITMVPWSILPIVIVFVGAENMFRLVDDVVHTSISLPVKERIAIGMSRAATSNTLKVVLYNSILGVIAFFATGAICQFCVFAIVVLVAHWFLIHTFFATVLSIDIQRLELEELIRQDTALAPQKTAHASPSIPSNNQHLAPWWSFAGLKNVIRGRLNKNFSLLLLLTITAVLYYATSPSFRSVKDVKSSLSYAARPAKASTPNYSIHSQAQDIWNLLNPDDNELVHLRIEPPTLMYLKPQSDQQGRKHHSGLTRSPSLRFMWLTGLFKILVLPVGSTISIIYGILLYLLKDAELLEAQRNKSGGTEDLRSTPIRGEVIFTAIPRSLATDFKHIATSKHCDTILMTDSEDEVSIWVQSSQRHFAIALDVVQGFMGEVHSCRVTEVAVTDDGKYLAIGISTGKVGLWEVTKDSVEHMHTLQCASSVPINQLALATRPVVNSPTAGEKEVRILAVSNDGHVHAWRFVKANSMERLPILLPGPQAVLKATLVKGFSSSNAIAIALIMTDGSLEIHSFPSDPCPVPTVTKIAAGNALDPITHVDATEAEFDGALHTVVAVATREGFVSLRDVTTNEIITQEETFSSITQLRVFPSPRKACSQCGEKPIGCFKIAYSISSVVFVKAVILTSRCSCPSTLPPISVVDSGQAGLGRRSRSNSFLAPVTGSPPKSRLRHPSFISESSTSGTSSFPVSGHGGHSRRSTEKDASRKSTERLDQLATPFDGELASRGYLNGHGNGHAELASSSKWRGARIIPILEASCERGGWDVIEQGVVGIRRRPRSSSLSKPTNHASEKARQSSALSSAVLDRWEVWLLRYCKGEVSLQMSPLSSLTVANEPSTTTKQDVPRLSFTRLQPVVFRDNFCVAGFGNTAGVLTFGSS